ncbi:hypothetical protein Tco_1504061 [Tanacetum coccineum]
MAGLEFCSKHNMVAYLEKTDGNTEFHQIMDFLTRSSIYYALTVSPIVSTSFVEQFWTTAKSRTVNNISYIDATVAGKPVTISEASIRSDLLFDDADGIDSLNNQAIFDNIQLMGNQLKDVPVPLDHFPVPTLTKKVLTFMVKKGKNFSGKLTPLFDFMLVQQTEDEAIPDSNPEGSDGNHGGQSFNDISLSGNEDGSGQEAKERSQTNSHTSQILDEECCTEDKIGKKDFSEEKGDPAFDDLDDIVDDAMDYMESEDAQDEGRTSSVVLEEKESADKEVSTEAPVSTVKPNEGIDKRNKGTDKQDGGIDSTKVSTNRQDEGIADQNEGKNATQTAQQRLQHLLQQYLLDNDEEVARKVQEEWEAKEEKKMLDEEEATKAALSNEYDFIQARLNADKILAEKL